MTALRKPVNLSVDANLLAEAKQMNVNISRAAEDGLRAALSRAWQIENAAAIESYNKYIEEYGLPLADLRQF